MIDTVVKVAAKVRDGAARPRDVVSECLHQIAAYDGLLGAFQRVRWERAVVEADELAGRSDLAALPLAGVPVAIKNNVPVAGEPMRLGSAATPDSPAAEDHDVVRRLRAAGAIVVGTTTMPELGAWGTTDGAFGTARNPWNPSRTAGGSSGGSAVAVAAGMVPAAHGNDGLGSVRIPAACCGLVGIKPGRGVVPAAIGATGGDLYGLAVNGVLGGTVADTALLLSVMANRPQLAHLPASPGSLRIAVSHRNPVTGVPVHPDWVRAVQAIAAVLRQAGHRVAAADPSYPPAATVAMLSRWFVGAAAEADHLEPSRLEPRTRTHTAIGRTLRRLGRVQDDHIVAWRRRCASFFGDHDVLLTPTLANRPPTSIGWAHRSWTANMRANVRYAPFTGPWNLAGYPAIAIPAGVDNAGLPLSVQLVAPDGGQTTLLSLARQIEEQRPWPRVAPTVTPEHRLVTAAAMQERGPRP